MAFISKNKYTFPVIYDESLIIHDLYRVGPIPINFFIDKEGIIKTKRLGLMSEEEIENSIKALLK